MTDAKKADENEAGATTADAEPAASAPPAERPAAQTTEKPAPQATRKPAAQTTEKPVKEKRSGPGKVKAGTDAVRSRIASLIWLVAVVAALFLAVGALLIALKMNQDNAIVSFVLDIARAIDLGVFKDFTGKNAGVKEALTNWGIAAVIYLVVGKVIDRVIRP